MEVLELVEGGRLVGVVVQLPFVARLEVLPLGWVVGVPRAQLGRRRDRLEPLIEVSALLAHPAWQEAVDEDPSAVGVRGIVVHPLHRNLGHADPPVRGDKVLAIGADARVNVAYASDKGWVSVSGTAELSRDRAKLEELWDPSASAFMSGGPDDPNSALLKVTGNTAQLWKSPGSVGLLLTMAKGLLGKDPAKDEDAPIVEL